LNDEVATVSDEPRDPEAETFDEVSMLPVVPAELGIDPLLLALLHLAGFLDLSGDDMVEPSAATDALEHVGFYVQRFDERRLGELQAELDRLVAHAEKSGWGAEQIEFVRDFLFNCGALDDESDPEPGGD
jgi:hypothetical protein